MSVQPNRSRKKQQKIAYELAVALEEAKEAGIPVILSDRRTEMEDDSLYTCWVGSDFAEEGRNAGHWLENYLEKLKERIAEGDLPKNIEKLEKYLDCYRGLDSLEEPMMKRIFSKRYLKDSKIFEREMERNVVTAARRYCPEITADMDIQTVLEQLLIEENSQELAVKGPLKLKIWKGSEAKRVDLSDFTYGVVLNSQTVKHAMVEVEQPALKKIVTIENKTNYLAMEYDPEILYIYSHGYFSPLEREFLKKLQRVIEGKDVEVFHSGDMDYGGIQIFLYNEKNIFPNLIPWKMDVPSYKAALENEKGIKLCSKKQKKLEALNAGKLEVLKQCILENKMEIEQEMLI